MDIMVGITNKQLSLVTFIHNMPGSFLPKLFSKCHHHDILCQIHLQYCWSAATTAGHSFQRCSHHSSCSWNRGFNYQMLGRGCSISAIHTHLKERIATLSTVMQITGYHPQFQDSLSTMKHSSMLRYYIPTMSYPLPTSAPTKPAYTPSYHVIYHIITAYSLHTLKKKKI